MLVLRVLVSIVLIGLGFLGCAKPPSSHLAFVQTVETDAALVTNSVLKASRPITNQPMPQTIFGSSHLAGRTLAVASAADIVLQPGEVILTFDDGPRPGKTNRILATLDDFGVKATFLMLGSAAQANPILAQQVAEHGNSVGSHTFSHVDLNTLTRQAALDEIAKGERAVSLALGGAGQVLSPFFRFPYLSRSGFLRTNLLQAGVIVLDVTIDSKDYYQDTPEVVAARTLSRLNARGSGVILFHDIHQRTVDMLPIFLAELERCGYSVVRLVPKDSGVFSRDLVTADAMALSNSL